MWNSGNNVQEVQDIHIHMNGYETAKVNVMRAWEDKESVQRNMSVVRPVNSLEAKHLYCEVSQEVDVDEFMR